jgi:hypothetical protein
MDEFEFDENTSGSTLRQKLEETIRENRDLKGRLSEETAARIIGAEGLKFVKPEDLKGVAPEEVAAKAKELDEKRRQERETLLKETLAERGLEGDRLEAAFKALTNPDGAAGDAQAARLHSLAGAGGSPVPTGFDPANASPADMILAGLKKRSK